MNLVVSKQAEDGFKRSLAYLSTYYSPRYLRTLRRKVSDALRWLKDHPAGGQIEPELEHLGLDHRRVIAGPFKIIYRVIGNTIVVNDIFDARRDPLKMKS